MIRNWGTSLVYMNLLSLIQVKLGQQIIKIKRTSTKNVYIMTLINMKRYVCAILMLINFAVCHRVITSFPYCHTLLMRAMLFTTVLANKQDFLQWVLWILQQTVELHANKAWKVTLNVKINFHCVMFWSCWKVVGHLATEIMVMPCSSKPWIHQSNWVGAV